jgi:archaemetzincin
VLSDLQRQRGVQVSSIQKIQLVQVLFAGDESGIVCGMTFSSQGDNAVVVSWTPHRMAVVHPLARATHGYQWERRRDMRSSAHNPLRISLILALLVPLAGGTMPFTPPDLQTRRAAIGSTVGLPPAVQRALEPNDSFRAIPPPGPQDWLANHLETGQTYTEFVQSNPNRPDARRHTLYLQPLGEFVEGESPSLALLQQFAAAFFAMDVTILPTLNLAEHHLTTRRNPSTRQRQLLIGDILSLLRHRLPNDAYALLGITMEDLYPDPAWNFVFGQASLRDRVGVYSLARYDPRFLGGSLPADWQTLLLRRSCKVLAHETAHMFGIAHCTFFHCLMNGSNHLAESDARPLHLCPVDLRKLYESVGFDIIERYERLQDFYEQVGFEDEAQWVSRRLARLRSASP